eukprot:10340806-Prorocentrum_lima.AAC.1
MASDWVSCIGGSKTGVYLLYRRPDCEWEHMLRHPFNARRFPGCIAANLAGKGIYPLNNCDWWLSVPEG